MWSSIRKYFSGDVSKSTLLTKLLPLSTVLFFGTLIVGICLYPRSFDWRVRVISHVISPWHNPQGYWIPSIGVALAALLVLPFAGYTEQRLRPIAPVVARIAGAAFALGFVLLLSAAVPQTQPTPGVKKVHELIARGSAAALALGMICCGVCALKDRVPRLSGRRSLNTRLAFCWILTVALPLGLLGVSCTVKLGEAAGHSWAEHVHSALQDTVLWRLAFWEWIGVVLLFAFLFISVLLLPGRIKAPA